MVQDIRLRGDTKLSDALEECDFSGSSSAVDSVAIVGFRNREDSDRTIERLKQLNPSQLKVLQVGSRETKPSWQKQKRQVAWTDLMSEGVDTEIGLLALQDRIAELRSCLEGCERVAILLQDDPDPDGLAGALALRKIVGRNSQTAPIVTFGHISRPENVAMAQLLGIEVVTIRESNLRDFEKIVLVDCQPSFFKGRSIKADILIDHHPSCLSAEDESHLIFKEIREEYGAISSLMTQYLRAANLEVSQRLATALLYGIKSDTLMLNREVSAADLEAFVFLYPLINGNILRKIERPELPVKYLKCIQSALNFLKVTKGIVVLPLGKIDREEWVAQAADFGLQIEGAEWALACGVVGDRVVISSRNCGYVQHSGEIFKAVFDKIGCAGGHRSMAKAIVPVEAWTEEFGAKSLEASSLVQIVRRLVSREVENRASIARDSL